MRFLKRQTTSVRNIAGKGIHYDVDDQVILESTNVLLIPKGTGANGQLAGTALNQRPVFPTNGHVRYNTTTNQLEAYQNGAWRNIRFKEPNQDPGIIQQNLGTGDGIETVFGTLNSQDTDYPIPAAAQNILVFVENVFQISTTNYTLEQSVGGNLTGPNAPYGDGWYIKFLSPVPATKVVTVLHNFDK